MPVRVRHPGELRDRIGERAELLLAFLHDGLLAPALGDVAGDGGDADHRAIDGADRRHVERDLDERSVLAAAHRLQPQIVVGAGGRDDAGDLVAALGGHDEGERLADRLLGGIAVELLRGAIPGQDGAVERQALDGVARGGDERRQMGVRHLGALALVDVEHDAERVLRHALLVAHRNAAHLHPHDLSVLADEALLDRVALALGHHVVEQLEITRAIVRMRDVDERLGANFRFGVAGDLAMALVGDAKVSFEIDDADAGGALVEHGAEARVALAHRRLGALAVLRRAMQRLADVVDLAQVGDDRRDDLAAADGARRRREMRDRARDPLAGGRRAHESERREQDQVPQDLLLPRPHRLLEHLGRDMNRERPAVGQMRPGREAAGIADGSQRRRSLASRRNVTPKLGTRGRAHHGFRVLAARDHGALAIDERGEPAGGQRPVQHVIEMFGQQRAAEHEIAVSHRIEDVDDVTLAEPADEQIRFDRLAGPYCLLRQVGQAGRLERRPGRNQRAEQLRAVAAQEADPAVAVAQGLRGARVERGIIAGA